MPTAVSLAHLVDEAVGKLADKHAIPYRPLNPWCLFFYTCAATETAVCALHSGKYGKFSARLQRKLSEATDKERRAYSVSPSGLEGPEQRFEEALSERRALIAGDQFNEAVCDFIRMVFSEKFRELTLEQRVGFWVLKNTEAEFPDGINEAFRNEFVAQIGLLIVKGMAGHWEG